MEIKNNKSDYIKLRKLIRKILMENIGPGPDDLNTVSDIYNDLENQFHYGKEDKKNYDDDLGYLIARIFINHEKQYFVV